MFSSSAGRNPRALPVVVALHARGSDVGGAIERARGLFGDDPAILAPQAARPCNPFQSNLQLADGYSGFSWYLGDDPSRPEAASFGDALAQLDVLLRRLRRPLVLCGEGQGAVLALTLGAIAPAGVVGVHAPGDAFPLLDGWQLPVEALADIEFLVDTGLSPASRIILEERGARLTILDTPPTLSLRHWLQLRAATSRSARRD